MVSSSDALCHVVEESRAGVESSAGKEVGCYHENGYAERGRIQKRVGSGGRLAWV